MTPDGALGGLTNALNLRIFDRVYRATEAAARRPISIKVLHRLVGYGPWRITPQLSRRNR